MSRLPHPKISGWTVVIAIGIFFYVSAIAALLTVATHFILKFW